MHRKDIKPNLMVNAKLVEIGASPQAAFGVRIGTVDHIEGGRFIEIRPVSTGSGRPRLIPLAWVEDVDDKAVYLRKTIAEIDQEAPVEPAPYRH